MVGVWWRRSRYMVKEKEWVWWRTGRGRMLIHSYTYCSAVCVMTCVYVVIWKHVSHMNVKGRYYYTVCT